MSNKIIDKIYLKNFFCIKVTLIKVTMKSCLKEVSKLDFEKEFEKFEKKNKHSSYDLYPKIKKKGSLNIAQTKRANQI